MERTATEMTDTALLCAVYRDVKEATEYLLRVMPRVEDEQLKHDMTVQISVYEGFASRAAKLLAEEGERPEAAGMMDKIGKKISAMMDAMHAGTTANAAKTIADAAETRAEEMLGRLREAERTVPDGEALHLARHLYEYEREQIERLRSYF